MTSKNIFILCLNVFKYQSRVLKEAKTLTKNSYKTDIFAFHEDGFKEFEMIDKINITRLKLKSKKFPKIFVFQLFKYLEFSHHICKKITNYNYLHIHSLMALPLAIFIKKFVNKKIKIIYDCHEYETERDNMSYLKKFLFKKIEKIFIKYCNYTITVSNSIMNEYKKLYNIKSIQCIYNTPFLSEYKISNVFRKKFKINSDHKIFLYQGGFSKARGILKYIEVFKQLKDFKCCLVLMGYGSLLKEVKEAAKNNNNIFFQDPVSLDEIQKYTSSADYGLNITENTCLSRYYALPNKLFEYVMARIPIIVSNDYERGKFVKENQVGFVVENTEMKYIKDKIIYSLKFDQETFFYRLDNLATKFNWNIESKKLLKIYKDISK
jgi:glycosyltransferase involved in cell wall biosynthesis